jgi:hypothetical protein
MEHDGVVVGEGGTREAGSDSREGQEEPPRLPPHYTLNHPDDALLPTPSQREAEGELGDGGVGGASLGPLSMWREGAPLIPTPNPNRKCTMSSP